MRGPLARAAALAAVAAALALAAPAPASAYVVREEIVGRGHGRITPSYLVIHETAGPGVPARNLLAYWRRSQPNVSMTQYVMDLDGSVVYRTQPDDTKAYQVGRGNAHCVGIELCHASNRADFERQWAEAVRWAGDYLRSRGWGVSRLISHNDCRTLWGGTDHTDPTGYFASHGRSWAGFKAAVASYLATGQVSGNAGTSPGGSQSGGSGSSGATRPGGSFAGSYTVMAPSLNVRSGPGTGYPVVASYRGGQRVNLEGYRAVSGWVWGTYTSYSGKARWVCVGPQTGGVSSRDYLVRGGVYGSGPAAPSQRPTSGYGAGRYTFRYAVNVRSGAGTGYRVVARYSAGRSVYISRTVTAGGYVWGVYTSHSGATRYVALGTTAGARYVR